MAMRTEGIDKWVRAYLDDVAVVDSREPLLFWEEQFPVPAYAFPRSDVRIDVVHTALHLVRNLPQGTTLSEVVDVFREPDLVHAGGASRRDEEIDRPRVERDVLTPVTEMHVVVDDHRSATTRSRSPASVTLISLGSPATTFTLPPRASTREEQSVAAVTSPAE